MERHDEFYRRDQLELLQGNVIDSIAYRYLFMLLYVYNINVVIEFRNEL